MVLVINCISHRYLKKEDNHKKEDNLKKLDDLKLRRHSQKKDDTGGGPKFEKTF